MQAGGEDPVVVELGHRRDDGKPPGLERAAQGGQRLRSEPAAQAPAAAQAANEQGFQFERLGYFCPDLASRPDALVFNRTIELRDTWAKVQVQG